MREGPALCDLRQVTLFLVPQWLHMGHSNLPLQSRSTASGDLVTSLDLSFLIHTMVGKKTPVCGGWWKSK